jgi:hypothetical protein
VICDVDGYGVGRVRSNAVFGIFKGDPSLAFHAQAVSIFSGSVAVLGGAILLTET